MKRRMRIQYTEADNALMWERWQRGESLHRHCSPLRSLPFVDWWDAFEERHDTAAASMSVCVSPADQAAWRRAG